MWLKSLQLANFRNYSQLNLDLSSGQVLLYGQNGEGKTNLVEAISYLSTLESHRVTGYQSLIQQEQPQPSFPER